MVETRRARCSEKVLAATLGLFVALGSPARALAQTPGGAGSSSWSFPEESSGTQAPAEPAPRPSQAAPPASAPSTPPAPAPPAEAPPAPAQLPPLPPAELPHPANAPPPNEPRFPVKVDTGAASVFIRGPGIEKPLLCSGTCAFSLAEGVYWFEIRASGRTWTVPVTVTEPWHVVIEKPNAGARGLGIAGIVVGGAILGVAGLISYGTLVSCSPGGPDEGTAQCDSAERALPYWVATAGVGAVVSAIGIGIFIANSKPSVEILPVIGKRARRGPETFIGLGPVEGSPLPGVSLRASF